MKNSLRCQTPAAAGQRCWLTATVLMAAMLTGCADLKDIKLHSDVRQSQGEAASKAWAAVDLKGYFDAQRDNLATLLNEEIASTQRLVAVNRETEIRELANTNVSALQGRYDRQLARVVGPFPAGQMTGLQTQLVSAWGNLHLNMTKLDDADRLLSFLRAKGVTQFTCAQLTMAEPKDLDEWKKAHAALAAEVNSRINAAVMVCKDANAARAAYDEGLGDFAEGTLATAFNEWKTAQQRMAKLETEVASKRADYTKALAAYNKEVDSAKAKNSISQAVKDRATDVAKALNLLDQAQQALGIQVASEERIKSLNDLLAALNAGDSVDVTTASKGELVAALLPQIADDARAISQARKGSALVPLMIQRDIEQGYLDAATVQVTFLRKRLALREALMQALLFQAITYLKAHNFVGYLMSCDDSPVADIGDVGKCEKADKNQTVYNIWDALEPKARRLLLESTIQYLDGFSRQQAQIETMQTQDLALERERILELSQVHATMWSSLIGDSVNQAAEFAEMGLKAEDFEKVLNLLGIFYIGHGVNK